MGFHNLRSFLNFLDSQGDLHRIQTEVDPILEITEIATRVVKKKGPALLFENVKGSSFPLLINALGTSQRVKWALGRSPEKVGEDLVRFSEVLLKPSPKALWGERKTISRVLAMRPKYLRRPPIFRNLISPVNLSHLPIAQTWPNDGGRFITFPLVITKSPLDHKQNLGVYRMHVYNQNETGMHWQIAKGGGYHYAQAEEKNQPLPLTAVVGADPILMMCGVLPLPEGLDEVKFAGFLRGNATRLTQQNSDGLSIPAEAEFALEGEVQPYERKAEGPYGDHFGHYSKQAPFPVFKINRIWHRDNPIFPVAVVGKPPQEDQVIGDAIQGMLLPLLKIMHPEIRDLWAYSEAGFHNLLVASVHQRFQKEAIKTALWVLGEGQLSLTKCVILVDPDVDARDFLQVLRAIRKYFKPENDFILLPGTSMDTLDFTSFKMNLGSKMILDATRGEAPSRKGSKGVDLDQIRKIDSTILDVRLLEDTLLVIQVKTRGRECLEKMLSSIPDLDVPLVAAVSPDVPLKDPILLIWGIFTRFDCERDVFFQNVKLDRGHARYHGTLAIDATWKSGYPEPLSMTAEIIEKVDRRWKDYGLC